MTRTRSQDDQRDPATSGPFTGGEMAARVNALDWSATPVGPIESWPQSLRGTIKTILGSRYPMILLWGPELIQIYNDAYTGLIGNKHPAAGWDARSVSRRPSRGMQSGR